eukprot:07600.XXX_304220_304351_1 [CDS] Oithona nana genome sequencing.
MTSFWDTKKSINIQVCRYPYAVHQMKIFIGFSVDVVLCQVFVM